MKICGECMNLHAELVAERRKGTDVIECSLEECEAGHLTFRPELPEELKAKTDELKEKTSKLEGFLWGWIYLCPSLAFYFWYYCANLQPGYCSVERPSDSETCDIHFEPWIWIDDLKGWYGGLINFGGCRPAKNCGGDCGLVNSKRNGICLRYYDEAPEMWKDGWLWCLYSNTGVTDCIHRTQYMVEDYYPIRRKWSVIELLSRLFRGR